jgi:hypothetical protein
VGCDSGQFLPGRRPQLFYILSNFMENFFKKAWSEALREIAFNVSKSPTVVGASALSLKFREAANRFSRHLFRLSTASVLLQSLTVCCKYAYICVILKISSRTWYGVALARTDVSENVLFPPSGLFSVWYISTVLLPRRRCYLASP